MKSFYLLLLSTLFVFLAGCINPQKLVEQSKYERALKVSSRQLKKGKVKWKQVDAFEKSFSELNRQDSLKVSNMRAVGQPSMWPEIYDQALRIEERQKKATPIVNRLEDINIQALVNFYPVNELLEEAADNSALYYYAYAKAFLETARKGNRQDARKAFALIENCRYYRSNFKDAQQLQEEMYELGTTHILLDPILAERNKDLDTRLFNQVLGRKNFPYRREWQVIHLNPETVTQPDYLLELYFNDLNVSSDNESSSSCCNSEKVEDGCKISKVWNATDSVWVEVKEVIYKEVSVQVTTYKQSKSANLKMHYSLVDTKTNQTLSSKFFYGSRDWTNVYSRVSGDDRALSFYCNDEGGSCQSFPSGERLLERAACGIQHDFYRELKRIDN